MKALPIVPANLELFESNTKIKKAYLEYLKNYFNQDCTDVFNQLIPVKSLIIFQI